MYITAILVSYKMVASMQKLHTFWYSIQRYAHRCKGYKLITKPNMFTVRLSVHHDKQSNGCCRVEGEDC